MKVNDTIRLIEAIAGPVLVLSGLFAAIAVPKVSDISLSAIAGGFGYMQRSSARRGDDPPDITTNRIYADAPTINLRSEQSIESPAPIIDRSESPIYANSRATEEFGVVDFKTERFGGMGAFAGTNKLGITEEDLEQNSYSELP